MSFCGALLARQRHSNALSSSLWNATCFTSCVVCDVTKRSTGLLQRYPYRTSCSLHTVRLQIILPAAAWMLDVKPCYQVESCCIQDCKPVTAGTAVNTRCVFWCTKQFLATHRKFHYEPCDAKRQRSRSPVTYSTSSILRNGHAAIKTEDWRTCLPWHCYTHCKLSANATENWSIIV